MLGETPNPETMGEIAIKNVHGSTVYLRDIATITPTLEIPRTLTQINNE